MINNPKLVAQNIISVLILLYNEFQRNCTYPFWEFNSNSNIINTENANTDVSINDNVINNNIVNNNNIINNNNNSKLILPYNIYKYFHYYIASKIS